MRDLATNFGKPFDVIVYPDAGHSLNIDYWPDLLSWLEGVIR